MKIAEIEAILADKKFAELDRSKLYMLIVDGPPERAQELTTYLKIEHDFNCIVLPVFDARLFKVEQ